MHFFFDNLSVTISSTFSSLHYMYAYNHVSSRHTVRMHSLSNYASHIFEINLFSSGVGLFECSNVQYIIVVLARIIDVSTDLEKVEKVRGYLQHSCQKSCHE